MQPLAQSIAPNDFKIEKWDRTKKRVEYNYLIEVSYKGQTTLRSKTFADETEADTYYDEQKADLGGV